MISQLSLALVTAIGIHANANVMIFADQVPTIVVAGDGTQADTAKVLNIINNSLVYSMVTTKIRNGSGNKYLERPVEDRKSDGLPQPKTAQNVSEYLLRQLSLYDLYFQRSLQEAKIKNFKVGIHLFPTNGPITNSLTGIDQGFMDMALRDIMGPFTPAASAVLKVAKPDQLNDPKIVQAIRDAQLDAAKKRYPADDSFNDAPNWAGKSAWLFFSQLPLSISSTFEVQNTAGIAKTSIIFPALGVPNVQKSEGQSYQTIDDVKLSPLWLTAKGLPGTTKIAPIESEIAVIDEIRFFPDDKNRFPRPDSNEKDEYEKRKKARALKVEFIKDFSRKHLMEADITFGYLPEKALSKFTDLNVDRITDLRAATEAYAPGFSAGTVMDPTLPSEEEVAAYSKYVTDSKYLRKAWQDLSRNIDFGLIAKGDVKFKLNSQDYIKSWSDAADREKDPVKKKEYTAKKDAFISENSRNEFLNKILDVLEIRIVFHKMHLVLDRLPTREKDPESTVLNPKQNDLNFFLNEDIGFKLKNMTLDKDRSVISFRLSVKKDKIREFEGFLKWFDIDAARKKQAINFFCSFTRGVEKDQNTLSFVNSLLLSPFKITGQKADNVEYLRDGVRYSPCEANFASLKDFKRSFLVKIINMMTMNEVGTAIKDSVDMQAGDAQSKLDKVVDDVAFQVLNAIQASRMRFDSVLGKVVPN